MGRHATFNALACAKRRQTLYSKGYRRKELWVTPGEYAVLVSTLEKMRGICTTKNDPGETPFGGEGVPGTGAGA